MTMFWLVGGTSDLVLEQQVIQKGFAYARAKRVYK
jgi:hypothetical protein